MKDCKCNTIGNLQKECYRIATEKGFILTDHVKQLLLIGTEVAEALDYIFVHDFEDLDVLEDFTKMMKVFNRNRKLRNLEEKSHIFNKDEIAEELADIVIRVMSYSGGNNIDLEKAILSKIEKNKGRERLHGAAF
jgi:NTP pyrophosphatase (non-canonical NTP hydrolase)